MFSRSRRSKDSSLFALLSKQAGYLVDASRILGHMLGANQLERPDLAKSLHEVEQAADEAGRKVLNKLNRSFVTPYDRDDIYRLSQVMDDCIDGMDEAGDLMSLYRLGDLPDEVTEQVRILARCSEITLTVIPNLARIDDAVRDYSEEIRNLENSSDRAYRRLLADLFHSGRDAIEIIKLKGVIDALENATDDFESLATVIDTIVVKES